MCASGSRFALAVLLLTLALSKSTHAADSLVMFDPQRLARALAANAADIRVEVRAAPLADLLATHRANLGEEVMAVLVANRHATAFGVLGAGARASAPWRRWCWLSGSGSCALGRLTSFRRHSRPQYLPFSAATSPTASHCSDTGHRWLTLWAGFARVARRFLALGGMVANGRRCCKG